MNLTAVHPLLERLLGCKGGVNSIRRGFKEAVTLVIPVLLGIEKINEGDPWKKLRIELFWKTYIINLLSNGPWTTLTP
jgi:hypothetical protein